MKRLLLYALLPFVFIACRKTVDVVPQQPPAVNILVGTWYLYDASIYDNSSWYSYDPQLYGYLSFYPDGVAQYDEGNSFLQGTWSLADSYDGYYDYNGYYHTNLHQSLSVYMTGNGSSSLNLYFDDISFTGNNQFTATYYTNNGIQRYTFRRDQNIQLKKDEHKKSLTN